MVFPLIYRLHFPADRDQSVFSSEQKSRQTEIKAFFSSYTQKKPEQAIGLFSCSGLLFHFLILWIADARNGRRLALHTSRQEH
jgi:hypothetical protein